MTVIMKEHFQDEKNIPSRCSSPTPFISHNAPEEEMELTLNKINDIPEPFKHCKPHDIHEMSIKYSPDSLPTPEVIFENVVVEYKSFVDQERVYDYEGRSLEITYLKTHVFVGIPTGRWKWLLKRMENLTGTSWSGVMNNFQDKEYTWVSAALPVDDVVHEQPKCYVFDAQAGTTVAVGSLYDVLTGLKSNLIGYGQFRIRKLLNFRNRCSLILLLTGFQIVSETDKQSYFKPCVPISPTSSIMDSLKKLILVSKYSILM